MVGGTFFFTLVTHKRRPILYDPVNVDLLRDVIGDVKKRHLFEIDTFVLLSDYLHWVDPEFKSSQ